MSLRQRAPLITILTIAGVMIVRPATADHRVAVLPTSPPQGLHIVVPGVPGILDSLIQLRLTQAGVALVALDTCRTATRAAVDSVGGTFDRRTGQLDSLRVERARRLTREALAQSTGADLFLEPALVLVLAKEQNGTATWDDLRVQLRKATLNERFTVAGLEQAGFQALSLRVITRDRQGAIVDDRQVGLRIPLRVNKDEYEPIPPAEWMGDPELNWSAVERAVQPLLLRLHDGGSSPAR